MGNENVHEIVRTEDGNRIETAKPEPPAPRKRKKYAARQGTSCPKCGENLRTLFMTLNEGGLRSLPLAGGCPKCLEPFKIHIVSAPEIIETKKVV